MSLRVPLHRVQYQFVASPERFTAFIGGIGTGKTWGGAAKTLRLMLGPPAPTRGLVVAPTYRMLKDATLPVFLEVSGSLGPQIRWSDLEVRLPTGSVALFRSADRPDRLRGPSVHWAWIDEPGLCPPETLPIVIGRLRAGGTAGPCYLTGTPKGRSNWLYRAIQEMEVYRATIWENPYLSEEYVAALERMYTGSFARQELYAEFVSYEGLIYPAFSRETHVLEMEPPEGARWGIGVDVGFVNPSAVLLVAQHPDGRIHVVDELYRPRMTVEELKTEILRMAQEHSPEVVSIDASQAALIESLRREGIPAGPPAETRVETGIWRVRELVELADTLPGLIVDPSCANTIMEFESYIYQEGSEKPVKALDHAMDALRYIVVSLRSRELSGTSIVSPVAVGHLSRWR